MSAMTQRRGATPTAADWARFLQPLIASVANPPTGDDLRKRIATIAFALPEITTDMLTVGVQREMVRTCKHWPTAAEVAGVFTDAIRHEREMREYRERPMLAAPEPAPRTPEQIAAARAAAQAAVTALRAQGNVAGAASRPTARPTSPHALLADYERMAAAGSDAAKTRVAQLRRALGMEANDAS